MRLVITGAAGFLGSEIARQAKADPRVSAVRLVDLAASSEQSGQEWLLGDLRDPGTRARILDGADTVIHLAATMGGAAEADPVAARETNIDVPLAMIEALEW